ncbi:MAG: peptide ABC transporter substrate-binding protein [bacterium]
MSEENLSNPVPETSPEVVPTDSKSSTKPKRKLSEVFKVLSVFEKIAFIIAVLIAVVTGFKILNYGYETISNEVPAQGGTVTEATTDYSRFINPVLARSDVDKDLVTVIYSGLLKPTKDNVLVNDLADSVNKSDNGLIYTVKLKQNLKFQDSAPLTADDVIFTIQKIQDPAIKSPIAANWAGVDVKKIDDQTIQFTLPQSYEPFIENLTVGILPSHLWASSTVDTFDIDTLNRKPVGSGPYKIGSYKESEPGVISEYSLVPFDKYIGQKPLIGTYIFDMYKDEDTAIKALTSGKANILAGISIDSFNKNKDALLDNADLHAPLLPRTYALFFNQSNAPILINPEVRSALDQAIDRTDLIKTVRSGLGQETHSPIPAGIMATTTSTSSASISMDDRIAMAQKTLTDKGWKKSDDGVLQKQTTLNKKTSNARLAITISTSNSPELKSIAEYVSAVWKKVGVDVTVQIYESGDLADKVIKPRKYDVLLFGQVVGRDLDLYPFWHSSQQKDLGLNLAMYANKKVDAAVEKLRALSSEADKQATLATINKEITNDMPAIFLYSPNYIFLTSHSVQGIQLNSIDASNERLYQVTDWYTGTRRILHIFK